MSIESKFYDKADANKIQNNQFKYKIICRSNRFFATNSMQIKLNRISLN
jgi:hypothetical protein